MLRELHIRNFALIDHVSIELGPGLNVFTGATGVGKSLVLGAFSLLLGGRASSESVRTGEDRAFVSGCFRMDKTLAKIVSELVGAQLDDDELAVSREVDAVGRSWCRINGMPVTVSMLRQIGEHLVDVHGQHDHESLRTPANQLLMLDHFGNVTEQREQFAEGHRLAVELRKRRNAIRDNLASIRSEADFLTFQLNEIDEAKLQSGEDETLEAERKVLASAERLLQATGNAHSALYESDRSVSSRLQQIVRELESVAEIDERLNAVVAACGQAQIQIEDAAFTLGRYMDSISIDPDRLAQVGDRIEQIRRLQAKYGHTANEILAKRDELAERLGQLTSDSEGQDALDAELAGRIAALEDDASAITAARRAAGQKLSRAIQRELKDLGMGAGKFRVDVVPAEATGEAFLDATSPMGRDRVEFQISTNPGEGLKPLRRIASGGEISRTMLAIKKCLARADRVSVFVFDEIDANIGGRLGSVVGQKLSEVARSHQVICVTHLPQIAAFADRQHKVHKQVSAGRTTTAVEALDEDGRRDELAEMMRGDEMSDLTRAQADEMLATAQERKRAAKKPTKSKTQPRQA